MLASPGSRWLDRRRPDSRWSSIGVSVAATAALFAAALASMKSVAFWTEVVSHESPTEVVRLEPPAPRPPAPPRVVRRGGPRATAAPAVVPRAIEAPPVSVPVAAPVQPTPVAAPVDTAVAGARSARPAIPVGVVVPHEVALPDPATITHGAAPMAPAGVVAPHTANTATLRESLAASRMLSIAELARTRAPTERELADLKASQRQAAMLARRATTAGNSRDVHVPMGKGVGGVGAADGGGVSIPFPLFSRGPSPAERRRNDSLDADYRLRLGRLQERARRLDSLRRDSLARLVKKP